MFRLLLAHSVATSAFAVDQSRFDLFLSLIRQNGCQMDDQTAGKVLPANGFTREEVSQIEKVLSDSGMIDKTRMGVFALTRAACKG
jgi:hypothetical protein